MRRGGPPWWCVDSLERAGFLAHARTAAFERKIEQAQDITRRWLETCRNPYVAFSGGKDSTVCLHLVRSIAPDTPALYWHDEWTLPETDELVTATPNVRQIAATIEHTPWFTAWADGPENLPPDVEWVEREKSDGGGTWKLGFDGACVGLRADENANRKMHIRAHGTNLYAKKNRQWQCYPLAWWKDADVWAYIVSRNVAYNRAYDRLAEISVPLERRRIGPLAVSGSGTHDPLHQGQLAILKRGWPNLFNRFSEHYPEARRYV